MAERGEEDCCSICLCGVEQGELVSSDYQCSCKFTVHRPCLDTWERSSRLCFQCKKPYIGADVKLGIIPPRDMLSHYSQLAFELLFTNGVICNIPFILLFVLTGFSASFVLVAFCISMCVSSRIARHCPSRRERQISFYSCLAFFLLLNYGTTSLVGVIGASYGYAFLCAPKVAVLLPLRSTRRVASGK